MRNYSWILTLPSLVRELNLDGLVDHSIAKANVCYWHLADI
jgi:hypothetical protein